MGDAEGLWNFDESPFKLAELNEVVIARTGVRNVQIFGNGTDREQFTVLAGGNAAGRMLRPVVLYNGTCHLESRITETRNECYAGVNKSGVMDCKVWNEYMTKEVLPALTAPKVLTTASCCYCLPV